MTRAFVPAEIEAAAHAAWAAADAYRVTEDASKPKFYTCSMLPYPSGKLHMGHVRNYTIGDMMGRQLRMKGFNVLMPMGWDAFGLPAENAAIENGVPPAQWTRDNIADMKSQMQPLGLAFDWSREIATCDPSYYRWNQWMFLRMLEAGIAYRKTQVVNWDPVDQTVLANEQVIDGRGWRSNALIEKREIPGYYLAITKYADELLVQVQTDLEGWPERVRLMQENWIGRSDGVRFAFTHDIRADDSNSDGKAIQDGRLYVFTTRADTIMGVTFCAVAPEHPLALHAAKHDAKVAEFIEHARRGGMTEAELAHRDKEGVATGLVVTHPLTHEQVPLWVGNYVLMGYGDGAVMGVPGHDQRDFEFAKKYGLPITQVVHIDGEPHFSYDHWQDWYADKTRGVTINSDLFSGMGHRDTVNAVAAALHARGLGEKKTTWRLHDWGISRQRYWGTPIPIIHCPEHGAVPVPERDLPVVLPEDCVPDGSGNPLNKREDFLACSCPVCGKPSRRETDTMDTFVDSAWYYMRYCDPQLDSAMVGAGTRYWMPMDQYIGGIEHAVLHLLYARFWTRVMRDLSLVDFAEPFTRLFTQGMLLNECYFREDASGRTRWYYPNEVEIRHDDKGRPVSASARDDGLPVALGGIEKMSKSKNNVVEPRDIIARYGADTARMFAMFAGPPQDSAAWSDAGVEGAHRYLKRLWGFAQKHAEAVRGAAGTAATSGEAVKSLRREVHLLLKQISFDYDRLQYNTVISGAMKLLNALEEAASDASAAGAAARREGLSVLLRVLYPACPHTPWALWRELGFDDEFGSLLDAPWPEVDEAALRRDAIELVLQVNGRHRGSIVVPASAGKAAIEAAALASPEVAKFGHGRAAKKIVVVPGKLVNVVV